MARPRVYRHDVRCPEYGSNRMPKDGASTGRQVYHCGDCGRRTIPDAAYQRPGAADQERALAMYQRRQLVECHCPDFRGQRPGGQPMGQKGGPPHGPGCAGGVKKRAAGVASGTMCRSGRRWGGS